VRLYELARGKDESQVIPDRPTQSISVEDTLEQTEDQRVQDPHSQPHAKVSSILLRGADEEDAQPLTLEQWQLDAIINKTRTFYLVGRADYADTKANPHWTKFCWYYIDL
jgi:nucleotidyltransferase/DNA polymerase involved in DNA repair